MPEHGRHLLTYQGEQCLRTLGAAQGHQPVSHRRGGSAHVARRPAHDRCPDQRAQHGGHPARPGPGLGERPKSRAVERRRYEQRPAVGQGGIEQRHALGHRHRDESAPGDPGPVGPGQMPRHTAGRLPHAPCQGHRRQPVRPSVRGQGVQEHVGGRVVALPRAPEQPRGGGEQHEQGQVQIPGQLVQVPRRVRLGPQHRAHLLRSQ